MTHKPYIYFWNAWALQGYLRVPAYSKLCDLYTDLYLQPFVYLISRYAVTSCSAAKVMCFRLYGSKYKSRKSLSYAKYMLAFYCTQFVWIRLSLSIQRKMVTLLVRCISSRWCPARANYCELVYCNNISLYNLIQCVLLHSVLNTHTPTHVQLHPLLIQMTS